MLFLFNSLSVVMERFRLLQWVKVESMTDGYEINAGLGLTFVSWW